MTILDVLKKDNSIRVNYGYRWLVFNPFNKEFVVHERKPKKVHSEELGRAKTEDMAVDILMQKEK